MIESLIRLALQQRLIVAVLAVASLFAGIYATRSLSVDAFPDVTNVQVQIATEAAGRSPEEIERFATVPLEIAMTGLPGLTEMRSLNKPGLSLITLVFTDRTNVYFARQLVMERLLEVTPRLPAGIVPVLGPVSTGLGEVYQYTLERPDDNGRPLSREELTQRRIVQDWVLRPMLRSISGVAEINSIGGYEKQYQILVDPDRLHHYDIQLHDVYQAVEHNNANSSGGILPQQSEQYLIRGIGLVHDLDDLNQIVIKERDGTPVYLRDVATVTLGQMVRSGAMLKNGQTETVGAIVMMLAGGNAKDVVSRIKARIKEINDKGILPDGLKVVPFYDRSELVDAALWTVSKVLLEGVVFVVIVLFLFLGDVRSSLIVVATLILTPLLTFLAMNKLGISANLMSLGGLAIAIGLMVDGSVVMVENAYARLGDPDNAGERPIRVILRAVTEVATPVVFGVGIIILVFLPLMTLQGMEGKMFAPLAYTIAIALTISLILSLVLSPVLSSYLLKPPAHHGDHDTPIIRAMKSRFMPLLERAMNNEKRTVMLTLGVFGLVLVLIPFLGTAFIPSMKEGSIMPFLTRVPNISLEESIKMEMQASKLAMEVPGVKSIVAVVGRGESPADPQGTNESSPIASLKPKDEWPDGWNQDDIAEAIRKKLAVLPGVQLSMDQPISQRVAEMVTGVKSDIAVKVFGDNLDELRTIAGQIAKVAQSIPGAQDMRVEKVSGQQYLEIEIDRQAIARLGLNVADVNDVIETAIGGKEATEIYEGERRFPAVLRLPEQFRNNIEAISNILLESRTGARARLADIAHIHVADGPAQISRELGKRRIVVGVNVKGRDLGGFVKELQAKVDRKIKLPEGYYLEWGGQFQNMERAMGHLMIIVPITIAAIFFLLFLLFHSVRMASLIILVLPFASMGGIIGLFVSGEYLSVPASVGFIALWGIAVLNGVVLVSCIRGLRVNGLGVREAVIEGVRQRFRPVMMTATVAMLGLIPFLFSEGPGSEVQRPLAIVVIGGLITSTLLTLVVLPTLYRWFDEKEAEA
ncbi:MAG TPA: CusA/CzcA family heavy metal efflux RND transporter [Rhodocyclaceae bacterium]|jgi:cobalt-zinc-cadmium resistance protein CzcA|nr:CusA/CzcA family heavy metal efflux RND transporter [Rhodocyclaceae bacterium]